MNKEAGSVVYLKRFLREFNKKYKKGYDRSKLKQEIDSFVRQNKRWHRPDVFNREFISALEGDMKRWAQYSFEKASEEGLISTGVGALVARKLVGLL